MNRRKFLKNSILGAAGTLLIPRLTGSEDTFAITRPEYKPSPEEWSDDRITISWIGHATVLINFYGEWILTDPVFFERVGVYFLGATWGPTRYSYPALSINEIPKPSLILLSHAHMDHTDYLTLRTITEKYPRQIDMITSYMSKDVTEDLKWKSVTEIDWGQSHQVRDVTVKAYEVNHFGWRFPWEKDRSRGFFKDGRSYNAYLIEKNGRKILFGGDTAMTDRLDVLKYEDVDVAIMPIGAYRPWRRVHCNPEEALIMADRIKAKHFIPIHCATFEQGREPKDEPLRWLRQSAVNYNINLGLDNIGKTFVL
ncbi:MAG: MBL fold metallo-hydrolase [Bacteroidota bacterium]